MKIGAVVRPRCALPLLVLDHAVLASIAGHPGRAVRRHDAAARDPDPEHLWPTESPRNDAGRLVAPQPAVLALIPVLDPSRRTAAGPRSAVATLHLRVVALVVAYPGRESSATVGRGRGPHIPQDHHAILGLSVEHRHDDRGGIAEA